jgi:hypothetical protein
MEKNANTAETTNAPIFIPHNYHTRQTLTSGGSSRRCIARWPAVLLIGSERHERIDR